MKKRKKRLLYQRIMACAMSICLAASSMDFTVLAEGRQCNHVHNFADCGYREAVEGNPCNKGGLTVPGEDAGHTHDENCGYVEAVEEHPCDFHDSVVLSLDWQTFYRKGRTEGIKAWIGIGDTRGYHYENV